MLGTIIANQVLPELVEHHPAYPATVHAAHLKAVRIPNDSSQLSEPLGQVCRSALGRDGWLIPALAPLPPDLGEGAIVMQPHQES